jgi:hypothetical protein
MKYYHALMMSMYMHGEIEDRGFLCEHCGKLNSFKDVLYNESEDTLYCCYCKEKL